MKNPFKKAVKILMKDFEDYNYLLGDLETYEFSKNNVSNYINDNNFNINFPITHKFILLETIISYVWLVEGSRYISVPLDEWKNIFHEKEIDKFLKENQKSWDIFYYVLKGYREECYKKYSDKKSYIWEPAELIDAWSALIPMLKYLYSISDEFK